MLYMQWQWHHRAVYVCECLDVYKLFSDWSITDWTNDWAAYVCDCDAYKMRRRLNTSIALLLVQCYALIDRSQSQMVPAAGVARRLWPEARLVMYWLWEQHIELILSSTYDRCHPSSSLSINSFHATPIYLPACYGDRALSQRHRRTTTAW